MSRSCTTAFNSYPPPMSDRSEFEAAEVLAGLSNTTPPPPQPSSLRGGDGESVDSWESVSKRTSGVRVKSESSPVDSPLNSVSAPVVDEKKKPVVLAFDLNEDQATAFNQEEEIRPESKYVMKSELTEQNPACAASHTGAKSRQSLSEAEKEARRLRRVLANRESARQTIRRRQALYEDLTRKVADLARENENLKKEKESALEVYQAVKSTNKRLNEQVAEQSGRKEEENVAKPTSANCSNNPPLPFANYPYIICKETPFVCPYNIQQPDTNTETSKRNPLSVTGPNSHWCMVPYPLFIPMPDTKTAPSLIPFFPSRDKETEATTSSKPSIPDVVDQKPVVEASSKQSCKEEQKGGLGKRLVDPAVAAEARKRRKELKKLKSLHCCGHRNEGLRFGESTRRSLARNS